MVEHRESLGEHKTGLALRGVIFEESPEKVTLKIGASLFEIMRSDVRELREVEESDQGKVVEATIAADARIIQRVLASASTLMTTRMPILAAACDCACNCNCACECACGSGKTRPEEEDRARSFRGRLREESAIERAAA